MHDIVLVSDWFGMDGYQLHGLFASFDDALAHVRKDEAEPLLEWGLDHDPSEDRRIVVLGETRWAAARQAQRTGLAGAHPFVEFMAPDVDWYVPNAFAEAFADLTREATSWEHEAPADPLGHCDVLTLGELAAFVEGLKAAGAVTPQAPTREAVEKIVSRRQV